MGLLVASYGWAAMLAENTRSNYQVGQPPVMSIMLARWVPALFPGTPDLGPPAGRESDILLTTSTHLGSPLLCDPIKALVDFGCGVMWIPLIVDGTIGPQVGRCPCIDEAEVSLTPQATHRSGADPVLALGRLQILQRCAPGFSHPSHFSAGHELTPT